MHFQKIKITEGSHLSSEFLISDDDAVLLARYAGEYRKGSLGNADGTFMFATLAAYYYAFKPIVIILDIQDVDYQWGNTISEALNFFSIIGRDEAEAEKRIFIVFSSKNKAGLDSLEKILGKGSRVYCQNIDEAMSLAITDVRRYLDE